MFFPAAADPKSISGVFVWSGVLVILLLIAFAGYSYLKRWMSASDEPVKVGLTLSDLRELHRQGKLSDAEYELTRANMLKSAKRATERMPEVLPRRPNRGGSEAMEPVDETAGDSAPPPV
jgi:hypothetical protein